MRLIEVAESEKPVPSINVITSAGDWIMGVPCSQEEFRTLSWPAWMESVGEALKKRPRRERKANPLDPAEVAADPFRALGPHETEGDGALNLKDATLSFGGRGDGLKLPVIRVPGDAVNSWWVAGHTYIAPKSDGGIGVGVLVPMGN